MSSPTIEKADLSMFDDIHPLLSEFREGPPISRSQWMSLLTHRWDREDNPMGFVMVADGTIIGFLATIFSQRLIEGRVETFCNLSSWIVRKEAIAKTPSSGIHLVLQVVQRRELHLTSLTPVPASLAMGKAVGWKQLEEHVHFIPDASTFPDREDNRFTITAKQEEIEPVLGPIDRRIFRDHVGYDCHHVLLHGDDRYCYVVFTRSGRLGVNHVHYVSDPTLFVEHAASMVRHIAKLNDVDVVAIASRLLDDLALPFGSMRPVEGKGPMYRSDLSRHHIDNLYSELILLGL